MPVPVQKPRILVLNPNTTDAITQKVAAEVSGMLEGEATIVPATGRFGAHYIASRAAAAIAAHAALDAYAEFGAACDAVLLACFGDPGLDALRELAAVPVVGLADAACHQACQLGSRFGIVTGGPRWEPMLQEFVASRGLAARLSGVRAVAPSGADIARDPDGALALLCRAVLDCVTLDGAECVILGGAGLVGLAQRVQPHVPVPVLCSVRSGAASLRAVMRMATPKARAGSFAMTPPVESTGLSAALAARLAGSAG
jgi:allantoin racemase